MPWVSEEGLAIFDKVASREPHGVVVPRPVVEWWLGPRLLLAQAERAFGFEHGMVHVTQTVPEVSGPMFGAERLVFELLVEQG